jgi:hypothetical protein
LAIAWLKKTHSLIESGNDCSHQRLKNNGNWQ